MAYRAVYHLNGDGIDASGNGYNGTVVGGTFNVSGKFNQCYSGVSGAGTNYMTAPTGAGLPYYSGTMSIWVSIASQFTASYRAMCGYALSTGTSGVNSDLYYGTASGTVVIRFEPSYLAGLGNGGCDYAVTLTTGTWYHVVGTTDSSWSYLYLNGKLVKQATNTVGTYANVVNRLVVGNNHAVSAYNWWGNLDEAIFDNVTWSASQVRNYYNQAVGRYAPKARF